MIDICSRDAVITPKEAQEWLECNTFGAYVGKSTPVYMEKHNG